MNYLIDGHNLIACLPDISLADPHDEVKLLRRLARWRWRRKNPSVTVVFDPGDFAVYGRRQARQWGITVRYAPYGSDADRVLLRLIEKSRQPAQLTVVSSDRELRSAARRVGACSISAEAFASQLATPVEPEEEPPEEESLSPEEVEAWLKLFRDL
jgi:predicted RNA-binding protein with PIN domain